MKLNALYTREDYEKIDNEACRLKKANDAAVASLGRVPVNDLLKISDLKCFFVGRYREVKGFSPFHLYHGLLCLLDSLDAPRFSGTVKGAIYLAVLWVSIPVLMEVPRAFSQAPYLFGTVTFFWLIIWCSLAGRCKRRAVARVMGKILSFKTVLPLAKGGRGWVCLAFEDDREERFYETSSEAFHEEGHAAIEIYFGEERLAFVTSAKVCAVKEEQQRLTDLPPRLQHYFVSLEKHSKEFLDELLLLKKRQTIQEHLQEMEAIDRFGQSVFLPEPIQQQIRQMMYLFKKGDLAAPRGLLLYGPPGTGKTLIAKSIADSCGCAFHPVSVPDLKMGYLGQSGQAVRKLWKKVRQNTPAILFVDECEGVFGIRGGLDADGLVAEVVQAFLAEWDGVNAKGGTPQVWVIGATNRRELIDPAILSRFGQEIEIPLPDGTMRTKILRAELEAIGLAADWLPDNIGRLTAGLSGRDLNRLAGAIRVAMNGDGQPTAEHLEKALRGMRKRGVTVTADNASWDTLVLDPSLIRELKTVCGMLNHAEELERQGITVPRGMILYGPPGTGKTQIARTLANESGLNFAGVTTADLKGPYVGHSSKMVKEVFARVRAQSPAILFIDEIDILCPVRGSRGGDSFTREIVGQLLQELDGVKAMTEKVFVVAATNLLESVDPAILSRFPRRIQIPLPDGPSRKRLLEILLRKVNHTLSEADFSRLADATEGKSGRDLRSLVEKAQNHAVARALEPGGVPLVQLLPSDFERCLEDLPKEDTLA